MALTPEEAELLQLLLSERERRECSGSLAEYIRSSWHLIEPKHKFVPGWHIDAIAECLEAVKRGEIRNLLINIPPRHAKSTIVSVAFPSWCWIDSPEYKLIYASHSNSLSKRDSIKTRNIIQSDWYRDKFGIEWSLAEDQNEKSNFKNTEGGYRRATSVLASIIGEGADCLVLDDPHSPRSVKSQVQRESEIDWIDQEFFTRINDPKTVSKICIMQRLDERDASAHLLEQGDWEHLLLPAEFEKDRKCMVNGWTDPRKEVGDPLWPERFDKDDLAKMKKNMGSKAWAGQGQQRPAPSEGSIFKRAELNKFYTELPSDLDFIALSVDLPFDEGAENSYAVFQVWGRKQAQKWLMDQTRAQCGFVTQIAMFKAIIAKWTALGYYFNAKWVEKKANGAAMISTLQIDIEGIVPITPSGSKEVRAEAIQPQFEAGNIWLPDPSIAPWISDYIEELVVFNNGKHNDQVDATTQALQKMASSSQDDFNIPSNLTKQSRWSK